MSKIEKTDIDRLEKVAMAIADRIETEYDSLKKKKKKLDNAIERIGKITNTLKGDDDNDAD